MHAMHIYMHACLAVVRIIKSPYIYVNDRLINYYVIIYRLVYDRNTIVNLNFANIRIPPRIINTEIGEGPLSKKNFELTP